MPRVLTRKPLPLVGRGWGGCVFGSYFLLQRADKKNEKRKTPPPFIPPHKGEGLEPSSYAIAADSTHAEVTREFAEGLIAELHRAEADGRVALFLGRVQLAHGEHGLAVALGVERHRDVEPRGIVVHVGTVLGLDQPRRFDPQERSEE